MSKGSNGNGAGVEKGKNRIEVKTGGKRPFPAWPITEALELANAIQKHASGLKVRRLTLFEQLDRSPDSGPTRALITNSARYGLTKGSYKADFLELTAEGAKATNSETPLRERTRILFELAINNIAPFRSLYEQFKDNRLPGKAVMEDSLRKVGVKDEFVSEGVDTFILNAKSLGLLRTIAGAERLVSIDQALDALPATPPTASTSVAVPKATQAKSTDTAEPTAVQWDKVCFYISPIGDENSDQRKHADLFLGSIIEPALEELQLQVVRADKISEPGIITRQIIEHVLKAKLVIADLSYHNPSALYELCLRHAARLPVVHLIRASDKIPFDMNQFRTIPIDVSDLYTFVPQLERYKAEVTSQVRRALENPDEIDNPISTFYPNARLSF